MDKNYNLDEICLVPSRMSIIQSRRDIDPFYIYNYIVQRNYKLPIFVAPMTCILDKDNIDTFINSKVIPIYPKYHINEGMLLDSDKMWISLSLNEFHDFFVCKKAIKGRIYHILIDCANGQMDVIFSFVVTAKKYYGSDLIVMTGNIANPSTYLDCCSAGIDYVRVGIGGNMACETGSKTGFHTSLPWLITEINDLKNKNKEVFSQHNITETKIIADGGIDSISKAIKCLALGADYVMCGRLFAKCKESKCYKNNGLYYGQASKQGIIDRKGKEFFDKHPYVEGSEIYLEDFYTLSEFETEFENVLRSAMSYANAGTLDDFIGKVRYEIQSEYEFKSYNK